MVNSKVNYAIKRSKVRLIWRGTVKKLIQNIYGRYERLTFLFTISLQWRRECFRDWDIFGQMMYISDPFSR